MDREKPHKDWSYSDMDEDREGLDFLDQPPRDWRPVAGAMATLCLAVGWLAWRFA